MVQKLWKILYQFLSIINILVPYDPAFVLLGIYPDKVKTCVHTKACMWML